METLIDILSHRREHGSEGVRVFTEKYLSEAIEIKNQKGEVLAYMIDNRKEGQKTQVLWSSHIDTMHRQKPTELYQDVWMDVQGIAFVGAECDCLGADDGAGVWLMLEMAKAGVAGVFMFHVGEEKGCIGSKQIAKDYVDFLSTFTHAIAFDRRGTTSIITHQMGGRAASDTFGKQFALLLNMGHELDPTGVYTDTAEYMDIVPECLNVSIGYEGEHGSKESLDTNYVLKLRDAMLAVDWENTVLIVDRDPADEPDYGWGQGSVYQGQTGYVTTSDLMTATMGEIEDWVVESDPSSIAYSIIDLLDEISELKYRVRQLKSKRGAEL